MASNQYIKDLEEANRKRNAAIKEQQTLTNQNIRDAAKRREAALNQTKAEADRAYADSTQAAYLQKMLARRELPELLYQQGYSGGLTESALIRLENQYGQAYRTADRSYAEARAAYNAELAAIRGDEAAQLAKSDLDYAERYAELAYTYQKERAKALEEQRAAELKAAAKASSTAKKTTTTKKTTSTTTSASTGTNGYTKGRARSPKDIYYSLF